MSGDYDVGMAIYELATAFDCPSCHKENAAKFTLESGSTNLDDIAGANAPKSCLFCGAPAREVRVAVEPLSTT